MLSVGNSCVQFVISMPANLTTTKQQYEDLSRKILKLDGAIISVTIANSVGEILAMNYLPAVEQLKPSDSLLDKGGSLIAMVSALAVQGEKEYESCKYIVIAFGKIEVAIVPILSKHIVIALGTIPDAPTKQLCLRVRELFR